MDLPGRPSGNADELRAGASAWDHLAWEIWQLSRALEARADGLAAAWSGAAADCYADAWHPVRRAFYELDGRLHDVAHRLRGAADAIEGGQAAYDRALAAAGVATAAGIGLTLVTLGLSDAAAAEADSAIAATAAAIIADLEAALARVATLFAQSGEAFLGLAGRFAVNFAVRAPELASGPAGGGALGVGLALASGDRDPGDLVLGGLLAAADADHALGGSEGEEEPEVPPVRLSPAANVPHPSPAEAAFRRPMSPSHLAKQEAYDAEAAEDADPASYGKIETPLTGEVAAAIQARAPGSILFVDRKIVNPSSPRADDLTDLDIETDSLVIQVKSGKWRDLSKQLAKSQQVTGKTAIGFAPAMDAAGVLRYRRLGYQVFTDLDSLVEFVAEHR